MNTKKSLKTSGLSIVLCIAMLIGTTFAWFTDSITNSGNVIQAGNLKIDATAYDTGNGGISVAIPGVNGGNKINFEQNGQDLKTDDSPIINEELFEPGKSNAKLLQVRNSGNLAAKIKLNFNILENGLMDALWFDFIKVDNNGNLEGTFTKRDMKDIVKLADDVEVSLKANEQVKFVFVYGMYESAGNNYKDLLFNLDVTINATQLNSEEDGFGNPDYDKIDSWDGTADTSWYDASASTYTLKSAESFAGLSQLAEDPSTFKDKTVNLETNIDLSNSEWTPIEEFSGTFNGNGKEIKGLSGKRGLFANIEDGKVKDLKITGAAVEKNANASGILCERVYGTTTFEDITVSGEVKNKGYYTGGMVGAITNWGDDDAVVTFKNCISKVDVTSTQHQAGGIAGCAYANTIFENCVNYGNVSEQSGYGAGGIVGFISGYSSSTVAPTFINCENKGNITGENRAGGIAGALGIEGGMGYYNLTATFRGCKNTGTISGKTTGDICSAKVNYSGKPTSNLTIIIE